MSKLDNTNDHGPSRATRAVRGLARWYRDPYRNRITTGEWLSLLMSLIIACVGILQWHVYMQQKKIMEGSSSQTDQLIEAAKIQAKSAAEFSQSASRIAGGVANAVRELQTQANEMQSDSQQGLRLTKDNFQNEQRAWVGLSPFVVTRSADEMHLVRNIAPGLTTTVAAVTVYFVNTGHTPALNVETVIFQPEFPPDRIPTKADGEWMERMLLAYRQGRFEGKDFIEPAKNVPKLNYLYLGDQGEPGIADVGRNILFDDSLMPDGAAEVTLKEDIHAISLGAMPPNIPTPVIPIKELFAGISPVLVFGEVRYSDSTAEGIHWTRFCSYTTDIHTTDLAACPVFNEMR